MSEDTSGGGIGCLELVLLVLVIWALLYGVTLDGTHYGISCTPERGVEFKAHEVDP